MTVRIPAYIAHPLNAPTADGREQNRQRAARWCAWLSRRYLIAPVADWIVLSSQWDETQENRALGLEIDRALVELCGISILTGSHVSDGMRAESGWARTVVDLTVLCSDPLDLRIGSAGFLGPDASVVRELLVEMDHRLTAAGIARAA